MTAFMRLRPSALPRPCDAERQPGLRSAPGSSCGYDRRRYRARATRKDNRASGLRLALHAATTVGPTAPVRRGKITGPPVCAGLFTLDSDADGGEDVGHRRVVGAVGVDVAVTHVIAGSDDERRAELRDTLARLVDPVAALPRLDRRPPRRRVEQ